MSEQAQLWRRLILSTTQEYSGKYTAADEYLTELKKDSREKNLAPPPNARKHTQHTSADRVEARKLKEGLEAKGGMSRFSYTDIDRYRY